MSLDLSAFLFLDDMQAHIEMIKATVSRIMRITPSITYSQTPHTVPAA